MSTASEPASFLTNAMRSLSPVGTARTTSVLSSDDAEAKGACRLPSSRYGLDVDGRTSKSKISVGSYSVAQALG